MAVAVVGEGVSRDRGRDPGPCPHRYLQGEVRDRHTDIRHKLVQGGGVVLVDGDCEWRVHTICTYYWRR